MPKQGVKKYFFFIKKQVSADWKDLAECLDFETPDIENIEGKRRDDKSRCMELLQEWQKWKGNAATIHVLMEALQEAELQHVVDSLKDRYPELHNSAPTVLPVHLQLGLDPHTSAQGGISKEREEQLLARILELERTLFTADVLMDDDRRKKAEQVLLSHKAFLTGLLSGSVLLLLTFLRQTDVDRFYHNHYRVGEGTLSQQLSHILISDDLQDKVKGTQLIVRLHVKHEDYVRVRDRLGQGLGRTTSADNLLALPPPSRHVDPSSLSGLDLAVVSREDQPCTDESGDIPTLNFTARQVQTAMHTSKEKSQQQVRRLEGEHREQMHEAKEQTDAMVRSQTKEITRLKEKDEKAQKILLEQKEENQKLSETNKSMAATIEEQMDALHTAKPKGGSQGEDSGKERGREEDSQQSQQETEAMQGQIQTGRIGVDAMMKEVKMLKEQKEKAEKILLEQKAETNKKIQQLQETNKSLEARIEELLSAKQPVEGGSQQKDPAQNKSDQHSKATTGEVKQSMGFISTKVERPWVKKVSFGRSSHANVAVSKDNVVYITDQYDCRILVFTIDGVYIREFTTTLPGETSEKFEPWDVAVDRNDNLWVASKDHVVQYSREGTCLATIELTSSVHNRSITVSMATEQVIVTDHGHLQVFNRDGSEVGTYALGHMSPMPWVPRYVTVDGEGNILVTDKSNHCVHVLDREGNFMFKLGSEGSHESQFKYPCGICVDQKGNIIVADNGNRCVKMFDSQGRFLCYIVCGMDWSQGVAVSPGGDVLVPDEGTVSVWTQG